MTLPNESNSGPRNAANDALEQVGLYCRKLGSEANDDGKSQALRCVVGWSAFAITGALLDVADAVREWKP